MIDPNVEPRPGTPQALSERVVRLTQDNPGPFTGAGTNTFLVGADRLLVIDPGEFDQRHLDNLLRAISGRPVDAILVTHGHGDHWPLAKPFQMSVDAPILGWGGGAGAEGPLPETAVFAPDRRIAEGDKVTAGDTTLRTVHTPGHSRDHVSLVLENEDAVFCGDHVMAWSTTIIAPPGGNLNDFMRSLERLRSLGAQRLYPAHGAAILGSAVAARIDEIERHRHERTRQALTALEGGHRTLQQLVAVVYRDVDPRLHGAAAMSLLAHLEALEERGRVKMERGGWELCHLG